MSDDFPKHIGEKVRAIMAASTAGELSPEKEALFVSLLKTEHIVLCAAVLTAIDLADLEGLYRVAKAMPTLGLNPLFADKIAKIDAKRAADAEKAEALANSLKPAPKKSSGPSPWGL